MVDLPRLRLEQGVHGGGLGPQRAGVHGRPRVLPAGGERLQFRRVGTAVEVAREQHQFAPTRVGDVAVEVRDLRGADGRTLARVVQVRVVHIERTAMERDAHVRHHTVIVERQQEVLARIEHRMTREDGVPVALDARHAVDRRERPRVAQPVRERLGLVGERGVLQHLLQADDIGAQRAQLAHDALQAARPVMLVVPQVERHHGERLGRCTRRQWGGERVAGEPQGHAEPEQ